MSSEPLSPRPGTMEESVPISFVPSVSTHFFKTIQAARTRDWPLCRALALTALGQGYAFLRVLQSDQHNMNNVATQLRMLTPSSMRRNDEPNTGDIVNDASDLLSALDKFSFGGSSLDWTVAHLSRGLRVLLHAEFNLAYAKLRGNGEARMQDAHLSEEVQQCQNILLSKQRSLYNSCVDQNAPQETAHQATALASEMEVCLPSFARAQAFATVEIKRRLAKSQGAAAERLANILCDAGSLTRNAIASHAAAHKLSVAVLARNPEAEFKSLITKASEIAFDVKLRDGKNIEIAKIGQAKDGDFVEVMGQVEKIQVTRLPDGKLVSRLILRDPSSEKDLTAVAVFAHLAHAGVMPGTFFRLHGTFRKQSAFAEKHAAVEIERLPQAELAKKSWRIGLLRAARPWFHRWRNGNYCDWTLAPHLGRSGSDGVPMFGANEIIFSPLLRS